jgi:hypothetical protein
MLEDIKTAMKRVGGEKYQAPKWTKAWESEQMYVQQ